MIERFELFLNNIAIIERYWHKIAADEMTKYGMKGPYALYFTTLRQYPEGITSAKLAELCNRNKADVSRAVSMMEQEGLIIRNSTSGNSYRALIQLTPKGQEITKEIYQKVLKAVSITGDGLSKEERIALYRSLNTIANNLQSIDEEKKLQNVNDKKET